MILTKPYVVGEEGLHYSKKTFVDWAADDGCADRYGSDSLDCVELLEGYLLR